MPTRLAVTHPRLSNENRGSSFAWESRAAAIAGRAVRAMMVGMRGLGARVAVSLAVIVTAWTGCEQFPAPTNHDATSDGSGSETGGEALPECSLRKPEGDSRATDVELGDWPQTPTDNAVVWDVDASCQVTDVAEEDAGTVAHHLHCQDPEGMMRPIVVRTTFSPALPLPLVVGDEIRLVHRNYYEITNFVTTSRSTAIRSADDVLVFLSLDDDRNSQIGPNAYAPLTVVTLWDVCPEIESDCYTSEWVALDVGNGESTLRLWSGQRVPLAAPTGTWTAWAGNLLAKGGHAVDCGDVDSTPPMALTVVWQP
jgi:hypothetical protein